MKKLPIGISSFEEIRTEGYYYVDKTHFVKKLVDEGKYYFLSRPRRFGKSLFVDTLKSAFEGKKELFTGLYLENNWNWNQNYPVVRFSFDGGKVENKQEMKKYINSIIRFWSRNYEVEIEEKLYYSMLTELIYKIYKKTGKKVVLLIDEYDKPILDNIEKKEIAEEIREVLKGFYQTIKGLDQYLKFVFITGISKFAKISLFSGLNQLEDISLISEYGDICGYTEEELLKVFGGLIKGDKELEKIREWYNGYCWLASKIYNPFDILLYLKSKRFVPYWYKTGTPELLIKLIKQNNYDISGIDNIEIIESALDKFDIDQISIEALMFQTGYLTIHTYKDTLTERKYKLRFPNKEVEYSFGITILSQLMKVDKIDLELSSKSEELQNALINENLEKLKDLLESLLRSISYEWYDRSEKSFGSAVYGFLYSTGFECITEKHTNKGRMDLLVITPNKKKYIFELKIVSQDQKGKSIQQVIQKEYHKGIEEAHIIGIEFNPQTRNFFIFSQ